MATTDPTSVARHNFARYIRARDRGHLQYVADAKKFDGIYTGEGQWDEATRTKLESQGRPALTFNMVLAVINSALGDHLRRAVQLAYKPRRNATREVAVVMNKLAMQILHANNYKYLESQMVSDGLIQDRGFLDVRVDFSDHMGGDIVITSLDPVTVVLDPDASEYDPATWNEVTVTRWMTLDEITHKYGRDKADSLRSIVQSGDNFRSDSIRFEGSTFGKQDGGDTYVYGEDEAVSREIARVRVIERQAYRWTMEQMFVDQQTGDMSEVPDSWSERKAATFAKKAGLLLHKRPGRRVRWTVSADQVLLYDDWSLYQTFTIIPFFPYFRRGKPFGMVRNLVNPQEYLNKIRSQELHIVNTTANSGWTVEEGTLVNMTTDELEQRGAETGLILEHARGTTPPQKIHPNAVPSGLDRISEKANIAIREISGINDGMLGVSAPTVSGVALDRKTQQGQIQLEVPATNVEYTRTLLAKKLLELIQAFYTEERVVQITYDTASGVDDEQVMINTTNAAGELVNDVTKGDYEVVVTTTARRENFDESQFADLVDMRANGIAIPDTVIIRHSNLANREEIAQQVEKLLGQAAPSEEEMMMMQQQQQLAIQTAQAELAKLQAQAESLQAGSALSMAKASQLAGGANSPELDLQRDELEAKIRLKREELQTRLQLAQLTHNARAQGEQLRTAAQLATTRVQADTQMAVAHRNAANKNPTPQE